ncbi:glyoxalase [Kribbella sandramycini]|uniref:Glyoxalase n=1 Tax=Kribbella sandramycini TaxID=60450 RepID=A0A7Y4KY52_9ACTN|nr:VOC family protein [Kribbella sandramycini]MBB6569331.1 putative enzyme related to lactoylglutathione lyase [Kribbella sandramycini]NOL40830.1 glyoxalase [Kribbella sandramycini]
MNQVVHFEIVGADAARLQAYYAELFGWTYAVGDAVSPEVAAPGTYGFVQAGLNGGVAGGDSARTVIYVGVDDVGLALGHAERLGGKRVFGPLGTPGQLVIGQFTDPAGNLIGVAGSK